MDAMITRYGALDMQVCVPEDWCDDSVVWLANRENTCGTSQGWQIRREGDKALAGDLERQPCAQRQGFVHIMLDA